MSSSNSIALIEPTSLNVYEADIFNRSRQILTRRRPIAMRQTGNPWGRRIPESVNAGISDRAWESGAKPAWPVERTGFELPRTFIAALLCYRSTNRPVT